MSGCFAHTVIYTQLAMKPFESDSFPKAIMSSNNLRLRKYLQVHVCLLTQAILP